MCRAVSAGKDDSEILLLFVDEGSPARNGDAGTVGLALLIAPDGHVADSKVTSTSGFRELDRAAMAALSLCKFKPATTNGVPESAWGKIAYVWTLEQ